MSLRAFNLLSILATILAWGALVLVINLIDPTQTSGWGFTLFYVSLFVAMYGTFFSISFAFRLRFSRRQLMYKRLEYSVRQSFFFAVLITGSLALQAKGLLTWWTTLLLIFFLTMLEFFFLAKRHET
ncbi:hypothetical protein CL634_01985 [bacterium]|nr:hypothetical protein [bacterium]|tara:strand:+ start:795 stop:1175 length:381 start_codon:yes stop_codon:yes gene_type:complete